MKSVMTRRWLRAIRRLLLSSSPTPPIRRLNPSARLFVELMEDRITPTQIGQFSFAANNDYTNTNNTPNNDTFSTSALGSSGDFQYQNIANLPAYLSNALPAHLVLT